MAISMKIEGIPHAVSYINKKKLGVKGGITAGMIISANELKTEVKESITGRRSEPRSVDTGELLRSVEVGTTANSATVFSDVSHAKFMEYGTSRIPERRHFRNSMTRKRQKITDDVQKSVNVAVNTI